MNIAPIEAGDEPERQLDVNQTINNKTTNIENSHKASDLIQKNLNTAFMNLSKH